MFDFVCFLASLNSFWSTIRSENTSEVFINRLMKRDGEKSVSKFLRNSLLLQYITDWTYTPLFTNKTHEKKPSFVSVFFWKIIDLFIVLAFLSLCVIEFSQMKKDSRNSHRWRRIGFTTKQKVMRDKKHRNVSSVITSVMHTSPQRLMIVEVNSSPNERVEKENFFQVTSRSIWVSCASLKRDFLKRKQHDSLVIYIFARD
jgi:hypothetical protein